MAKIAAYRVTDFSGGVRRDKSPFELQKNELLDARNVEIRERGRLITRRGSYQIGQTLSGTIQNSTLFQRGGISSLIINNNANPVVLYRLLSSRLSTAITTASTTIVLNNDIDEGSFANTGNDIVEIEGDLITYTGGGTTTTLTGVTGITSSHAAGVAVNQWRTVTQAGTSIDGRRGVYYATINNVLVMNGRNSTGQYIDNNDTITTSDFTTSPAGLFVTNYRDRLYMADEFSPLNTVYFSNRGTGLTWTTASDFFRVEDSRGEPIVGFRVFKDLLGIFKPNSIFTYDEIELKQRVIGVGAYNLQVVQEVAGKLFTFSPTGIWETNLFSAKNIGEPVKEYWKSFSPVWDSAVDSGSYGRIVTNTWATSSENFYILYLQDVTTPNSANDVTLIYDIVKENWTVFVGAHVNFGHLKGFENFHFGGRYQQLRPTIFGGNTSGQVFRMYESRFVDSGQTLRGDDVFQDLVSNTGSPISASIETPFYDLTYPNLFKTFRDLRVLSEGGMWAVEYRVENEQGISAYRPLGVVTRQNQVLPFPSDAQGFRLGLRFNSVNTAARNTFNGFVIENTEVDSRT